jgi:3-hydroxyisobutyrate dehydrogenase-like beta-hydroxyacid dehydrogenase
MSTNPRICLIGFGEVGQILASDLRDRGHRDLSAWDVLFADPRSNPSRAVASLATAGTDARSALTNADIVISAVTAAQCIDAARTASPHLAAGAFYVDLNSVAPSTKTAAATLIAAGAGRYVEAAVMAPIGPKRSATSMLLGGPHAAAFLGNAQSLGFTDARVYSDTIGKASAAKMCRSVMVKGIEALLTESMLSARRYGVEHTVLESLRDLFPGADWPKLSRYMISRSLQHGRRRAEEMREVAVTVSDAGIEPHMSAAAAQRHDWAAEYSGAAHLEPLEPMLDAILASLRPLPHTTGRGEREC